MDPPDAISEFELGGFLLLVREKLRGAPKMHAGTAVRLLLCPAALLRHGAPPLPSVSAVATHRRLAPAMMGAKNKKKDFEPYTIGADSRDAAEWRCIPWPSVWWAPSARSHCFTMHISRNTAVSSAICALCRYSDMFPRPERRDAVAVHKKHAKKGGCAASKAPAEALCAPLATLNIAYPKLRVAHLDPLVLSVDDFLNGDECDELIALASHADDLTEKEIVQVPSPDVESPSRHAVHGVTSGPSVSGRPPSSGSAF